MRHSELRSLVAFTVLAVTGVLHLLPPAAAQPLRAEAGAVARYTHHPAAGAPPRRIILSMDGPFTFDERAKILQAIGEWNYALNGFIRLEVVTAGQGGTDSWTIRSEKGGTPQAPDMVRGQPLSSTQSGFLGIGGRMVIYVDRIGTRDLRGIVLHEFGHVLGLNHDRGHLMGPRYQPTTEQCIDRETTEAIAARHNLPAASLNWCDAGSATK
jgi:hypothetical protein